MITILIVMLAILAFYKIFDKEDWEFNVFAGFSISLIAFLLIITSLLIGENFQVEIRGENCSRPIYSLKNSDGITGRFALGSGYINLREYYYLFVRNENGGNIRWQLRASDCIIYQKEESSPYIQWQKIYSRHSKWVHIWPVIEKSKYSMYNLFIPSNSIVESFNIK